MLLEGCQDPVEDEYSGLSLPAGTSEVEGDQALAFLRTRHSFGDGGDTGRIAAQQSFMASLARKVLAEGTLTNLPKLYSIADVITRCTTEPRYAGIEKSNHRVAPDKVGGPQ